VIPLHLIKLDILKFYSFDELHEGYIFGQDFGFEVSIDHISSPHIKRNQRKLNLDNADRLFTLIKYNGAIFSPLVLKSIGIQEENSNKILYFYKNYTFEQTMENLNYVTDGQPKPDFSKRLRWQPMDGQHVVWTCKNAKKKLEKINISQSIYDPKVC
jgi:hypothetical protein